MKKKKKNMIYYYCYDQFFLYSEDYSNTFNFNFYYFSSSYKISRICVLFGFYELFKSFSLLYNSFSLLYNSFSLLFDCILSMIYYCFLDKCSMA